MLLRRLVIRGVLLASLAAAFAAPAPAQPSEREQALLAINAMDQRVATIGYRLAIASLDFCADRAWLPGFVIHDLSQYGEDYQATAIRAFGLDAGPAVLALAAGGAAEQAGLRLGDTLVALDGAAVPRWDGGSPGSFTQTERVLDALDAAFADGTADIAILRDGAAQTVHVAGKQGCASRFQLAPSDELNARADGEYVQVTTRIADYVRDDDELAAVLAHEFAHNLLHHRVRLDEAHVARGFLGNFGRNARLIRDTEVEADRLSVYLMERAGYDPAGAVRFWSRFGRRGLNFLGSPTHPNWRRRVAMFEEEIAAIRAARAAGEVPRPAFLPTPQSAEAHIP